MSAFAVVLAVHIAVGTLTSITGFIALFSRKGARLHRKAGGFWVVAMLVLAASVALLGVLIAKPGNIVAAILTAYLVASAWLAVRRPPNVIGWAEGAMVILPLTVAALSIAGAVAILASPGGPPADLPPGERPPVSLTVAAIALLAAGCDLRVMLKGGLAGAARIARHIWRMCLALFIATGSFGAQIPVMLRRIDVESPPLPVIFGPAVLVLALLAFWMIRVRIGPRFKAVG
jgi:uncharacterized membrane protein